MKRTILGVLCALAIGNTHAMSVSAHVSAPHVSVHVAEVPHISESVHVTEAVPSVHEAEEMPSVSHSNVSEDEAQHPAYQGTQQLQRQIALSNAQNARVMAEYASDASAAISDASDAQATDPDADFGKHVILALVAVMLLAAIGAALMFKKGKRNG